MSRNLRFCYGVVSFLLQGFSLFPQGILKARNCERVIGAESVYLGCTEGDAGLREYQLVCSVCGQGFSIFTPADGLSRGRGYSVDCPVCNGLHLDANGLVMSDLGDPKAPLRLN